MSLSCIWTFVLSAFIESMVPGIMKYHTTDKEKYRKLNIRLYAMVFYISVFTSVVICIMAPVIIAILYGKEYLDSIMPLRIVVWYVAFSYLGVARDAWVVCERKQKYLKYLYLGSAVCNVILNAIFIPAIGASGAAIATVITQISTIFLMPMLIKEFHPNVKMMVDAILLKEIIKSNEAK